MSRMARAALLLLALVSLEWAAAEVVDLHSADDCAYWTESGQCEANAAFMKVQCAASCERRRKAAEQEQPAGGGACVSRSKELEAQLEVERARAQAAEQKARELKALKDAAVIVQKQLTSQSKVGKVAVVSDCESCFENRRVSEAKIKELRRQLEETDAGICEARRLQLQSEVDASRAQVEDSRRLQQQLELAVTESRTAQAKSSELELVLAASEKKIKILEEQEEQVQMQLKEHQKSASRKQSELEAASAELESAHARSSELQKELEASQTKSKSITDEKEMQLQRQLMEQQNNAAGKQRELEAAVSNLEIARARTTTLEREFAAAQGRITALTEEQETRFQRQLEERQKDASAKLVAAAKEVSVLEARLARVTAESIQPAQECEPAPQDSSLGWVALCFVGAVQAVLLVISCLLWRRHHQGLGASLEEKDIASPPRSVAEAEQPQAAVEPQKEETKQMPPLSTSQPSPAPAPAPVPAAAPTGRVEAVVSEVEARIASVPQRRLVPTPHGLAMLPAAARAPGRKSAPAVPTVEGRLEDIQALVSRLDEKLDRVARGNEAATAAPSQDL